MWQVAEHVSTPIYGCITYVETSARQLVQATKAKASAARQTRLIPTLVRHARLLGEYA